MLDSRMGIRLCFLLIIRYSWKGIVKVYAEAQPRISEISARVSKIWICSNVNTYTSTIGLIPKPDIIGVHMY